MEASLKADILETVQKAVQAQLEVLRADLEKAVREEMARVSSTSRPTSKEGYPDSKVTLKHQKVGSQIKPFQQEEKRTEALALHGKEPPMAHRPGSATMAHRQKEKPQPLKRHQTAEMRHFLEEDCLKVNKKVAKQAKDSVAPVSEDQVEPIRPAAAAAVSEDDRQLPGCVPDEPEQPESQGREDTVATLAPDRPDSPDGRPDRLMSARSSATLGGGAKKKKERQGSGIESAMAFGKSQPNLQADEMDHEPYLKQLAMRAVRDTRFELASTTLVVASAMHIGLTTDYAARHVGSKLPEIYHIFDVIFVIAFTFEIGIRMCAYRSRFFSVWGWAWNIFDLILVISQWIEEALVIAQASFGLGSSGAVLRIVRVLRTVRTIRVLHVMRFASELQMLVSCLMRSAKAFVWSLGLIVLMLYVVAVYFTQLCTITRLEEPDNIPELAAFYGSVPLAVLSLFQGLTGGLDWSEISDPMITHVSPYMGVWFFLYTAFALLLVMNVVNATFVESAIDRAQQVREMQKLSQASRLFKSLDQDESGVISFDELEVHLESTEVQEFFESIDVDASEAKCLFDLIDTDGSGEIEFNEFLSGCLRLQGPAKSMDLVQGLHHLNRCLEKIAENMGITLKGMDQSGVQKHISHKQ